ncbi:MAG: VCBS repeat-containing protein [Chitinophagales bacterium]|nr:VCBS repeat-containing protein [Chitinophagales bacterium]
MMRLSFTALFISVLLLCGCNRQKKDTLFTSLSSEKTHINFSNHLPEKERFNILYYLYYYNGGGVAVGDINNDGLADIYFTANQRGKNRLFLNKGNLTFEDITATAGVAGQADWCSGVTMADVNGDGLLDIYVSAVSNKFGLTGHNELFINNGNNRFTEKSEAYGLNFSGLTTQTVFFDYDHDGDLDCYILNQSDRPHANVVDTSSRHKYDSLSGDLLLRNDLPSSGRFTDVSKAAGIYQSNLGYGLGLSVADLNNDGWEDIYVGNDFHENDYCYINNGNGSFTENGAARFRHYSRFSMGNDINDYNNDGQPDVITVDMLPPDEKTMKTYGSDENPDIYRFKLEKNGYQQQVSRNVLQHNNGSGVSFSDIALQAGVSATDWSWAPLFADFDNDGRKDLFISSGIVKRPVDMDYIRFVSNQEMNKGLNYTDKFDNETIEAMPEGSSHPFFFRNDNGYTFQDVSKDWGTGDMKGFYNGSAYADFDNDGDLDMVINCLDAEATLLRNNSQPGKQLSFRFSGDSMNRYGIGAKLYLWSGGQLQYQQLMTTRGFQSSVEPRMHFGLGTATLADSVLVVWPDQRMQVVKQLPSNKEVTLEYKNATGQFAYATYFPPLQSGFTDITASAGPDWSHRENEFNDFDIQYLIPHTLSARGPKTAVADVNGDGRDDIYVCSSKGETGALLIQGADGRFSRSAQPDFELNRESEDVDAAFFDANGDKHPDLLVITGGNEVLATSRQGEDRLYINDGKGNFKKKDLSFPIQYESKSCIAVSDFDKDGDMDFFIGNLASQTQYGDPVNSYLYINRGDAIFDLAERKTIFLQKTGMVTSAVFADVNKDSWPDLVLTGEWMPVKIFINKNGQFTETAIPHSTGLWQSLYAADVNGDGFTDLLAGNWGHNSKLWAGKNGPLKLFMKDFDKNGTVEQILCYTIDKKEYTFLGKDELERSLPVLKKAYLKYSDVAGKTVQYMFYDLFNEYITLEAETLSSSCFLNDGKGGFTRITLDDAAQSAPLMCMNTGTGKNGTYFLGAGNYYGVIPFEGRYDALQPLQFSFSKEGKPAGSQALMNSFSGEARDIDWVRTGNGDSLLVIARNNAPLVILRKN